MSSHDERRRDGQVRIRMSQAELQRADAVRRARGITSRADLIRTLLAEEHGRLEEQRRRAELARQADQRSARSASITETTAPPKSAKTTAADAK